MILLIFINFNLIVIHLVYIIGNWKMRFFLFPPLYNFVDPKIALAYGVSGWGSQPRKLRPNDISLIESLGTDFFEALFVFHRIPLNFIKIKQNPNKVKITFN